MTKRERGVFGLVMGMIGDVTRDEVAWGPCVASRL